MADLERVEQELGEAIGAALTPHGLLGNRWVLVAEFFDEDGKRRADTFTSQDLRSWDSYGLLMYALQNESAAMHAGYAALDEEDEEDEGGGDAAGV